MRSILVFAAIILQLAHAAPLANNYVENPDDAMNGTVYSISHLFPKTEEFTINHEMCIQFSYKLMERKVKLRAYTCRLSEGGFCTTDSYSYPTDQKDCDYLRPWSWTEDKWGFYFVLERRPRRFGSRAKTRRISKRQDSRPVGQIQIDGLIPCKNVCNRYKRKKY